MEKYTDDIRFFWQWFENQYETFFNQNCVLKKPAHQLQHHLEAIHPDLCFQIAHRADEHHYELVFSCGANTALKPLVKAIAACAPSFPLIRIAAFKQRAELCEGICLDDTTIHVENVRFKLTTLLNKVVIHIYTLEDFSREDIQVALILLLENLIGEELMLDHVADIQFYRLRIEEKQKLPLLNNIPAAIDQLISTIENA